MPRAKKLERRALKLGGDQIKGEIGRTGMNLIQMRWPKRSSPLLSSNECGMTFKSSAERACAVIADHSQPFPSGVNGLIAARYLHFAKVIHCGRTPATCAQITAVHEILMARFSAIPSVPYTLPFRAASYRSVLLARDIYHLP